MTKRRIIITPIVLTMLALVPLVIYLATKYTKPINKELGNDQGLILNYCYVSMGSQLITDVTNYDIDIYRDKIIINIHLHDMFSDIESTKEISIDKSKSKSIESAILRNGLLNLTEKDNSGCDGYYTTMTIYTDKKSKKIGGYLYDNKKYNNVRDIISDLFGEEIDSFIEETQSLVNEAFENKESNN